MGESNTEDIDPGNVVAYANQGETNDDDACIRRDHYHAASHDTPVSCSRHRCSRRHCISRSRLRAIRAATSIHR